MAYFMKHKHGLTFTLPYEGYVLGTTDPGLPLLPTTFHYSKAWLFQKIHCPRGKEITMLREFSSTNQTNGMLLRTFSVQKVDSGISNTIKRNKATYMKRKLEYWIHDISKVMKKKRSQIRNLSLSEDEDAQELTPREDHNRPTHFHIHLLTYKTNKEDWNTSVTTHWHDLSCLFCISNVYKNTEQKFIKSCIWKTCLLSVFVVNVAISTLKTKVSWWNSLPDEKSSDIQALPKWAFQVWVAFQISKCCLVTLLIHDYCTQFGTDEIVKSMIARLQASTTLHINSISSMAVGRWYHLYWHPKV